MSNISGRGSAQRGIMTKFIFSRRLIALAGLILVTLALAGCFDNEPEQRKAFVSFLQTRIIDKPGLHIPIMSEKDLTELGPYADQYRILNGFHHSLDKAISTDLVRAMSIGQPRSLEELRNNRALLPVLIDGMTKMKNELDAAEAQADAAHAALKQPPDLKVVYDNAYRRMVTIPAGVFREIVPMTLNMLPAVNELATYLDQHRDTIVFNAGTPVVKDPAVRTKLAALMQSTAKATEAVDKGKRKLRAMAEGR